MTDLAHLETPAARGRGWFWAAVPAVLLVASTVGVGTMASIAARDPGFSLEKNYYDKAVHWDRQEAQRLVNERLGYRLALELERAPSGVELVARLSDREGVALAGAQVSVEAFANARASELRHLVLRAAPDGSYRAVLANARPGLWEFRCDVHAAGEHFTRVVRADVGPRGTP
jgi:hypothetical protein